MFLSTRSLAAPQEEMRDTLTAQWRAIMCLELKLFGKMLFELIEGFLNLLTSLPNFHEAAFLASVYKSRRSSDDLSEFCHGDYELVTRELNGDILFGDRVRSPETVTYHAIRT
jgi:hypothetical protein